MRQPQRKPFPGWGLPGHHDSISAIPTTSARWAARSCSSPAPPPRASPFGWVLLQRPTMPLPLVRCLWRSVMQCGTQCISPCERSIPPSNALCTTAAPHRLRLPGRQCDIPPSPPQVKMCDERLMTWSLVISTKAAAMFVSQGGPYGGRLSTLRLLVASSHLLAWGQSEPCSPLQTSCAHLS